MLKSNKLLFAVTQSAL